MLKQLNLVVLAVVLATLLGSIENAIAAPVLAVDFDGTDTGSVTQPGFNSVGGTYFDTVNTSFNGVFGPYTVTTTFGITSSLTTDHGFYNRGTITNGGALSYAALYNDFMYSNIGGDSITLSIAGLDAGAQYLLTVYSLDTGGGPTTTTFAPLNNGTSTHTSLLSGTNTVTWTNVFPTTNFDYSTRILVSSSTNTLDFLVTSAGTNLRFNGFVLNVLPEPSSALLALVGVCGAGRFVRRRKTSPCAA